MKHIWKGVVSAARTIHYELNPYSDKFNIQDAKKKLFPHDGQLGHETVAYCKECKKFNREGKEEDRHVIVSNYAIYLLGSKNGLYKFPLYSLKYIIKSKTSKEIAFHFDKFVHNPEPLNETENELEFAEDKLKFDIRLDMGDEQDALLNEVKCKYKEVCGKSLDKVYNVDKENLKDFKSEVEREEPLEKYKMKEEMKIREEEKSILDTEDGKDWCNDH